MKKKEPVTLAQKIYGAEFGNAQIICERPDSMRSSDPDQDKVLFRKYKVYRRQQTKNIEDCLRQGSHFNKN